MGYLSSESKSTSKNTTAPLSSEGEQWNSIATQMMLQSLEDAGYSYDTVEKTKYSDPSKFKQLSGQQENIQKQLDALNADIKKNPFTSTPTGNHGGASVDDRLQRQRDLQQQLYRVQDDVNKLDKVTYTDYTLNKKEDIRVENAKKKYGENSPEVTKLRNQVSQEESDQAQAMVDVNKDYLKNMIKFSSGDVTASKEQKAQIDDYYAPIRDVIKKTSEDLLSQYENDNKTLTAELGKVSAEIDKTGLKVNEAFEAASIQIDKSNSTLLDVLQKANKTAEDKATFQFGLMSQEIETKNAQQAALLGLPPGSAIEKIQTMKQKSNALANLRYSLSVEEMNKELGIQDKTEDAKKSLKFSQIDFAKVQGDKKEGVAQQGFGLAATLASQKEGLLDKKNQQLIQLQGAEQAQLYDVAYGSLPGRIQAGQSALGFDQNMKNAKQSSTQQLLNPFSQMLNTEQQRTFAESTNNTKTSSTPSGFDTVGATLGMAGSVASIPFTGGASTLNLGGATSKGSSGGFLDEDPWA